MFLEKITFQNSILILVLLYSNCAKSTNLVFHTHSSDGSIFTDELNETRGVKHAGRRSFYVELIHEMMKITGHTPKIIHNVPLKRAIKEVRERPNRALFSLARTNSREKLVKWVGPLHSGLVRFYEAAKFPQEIKNLDDAKQVRSICVIKGGNHWDYLIEQGYENIVDNVHYEACLSMLAINRVSLVPLAEKTFESILGLHENKKSLIKPSIVLYETQLYIAFSKNISDAEIDKWQKALDILKKTGVYEKLERQYLCLECTDE